MTAPSIVMTIAEAMAQIPSGATVVTGGASLSRKPMALVRALARSDAQDLRLVCFMGGPDADLLIAAGKVAHVTYSYVGLESAGLALHFRRAREQGTIAAEEWSEGMIVAGLEAGARRLPFFPTRSGLGTDLLNVSHSLTTFVAPFTGETLVAVPAITPDVALIHVTAAHPSGYGIVAGDLVIDDLACRAARKVILSCERLLSDAELEQQMANALIHRIWVDAVVVAPQGAHPTACFPDYPADLDQLGRYAALSREPERFATEYLNPLVLGAGAEAAYLQTAGWSEGRWANRSGRERDR